MKFKFAIWLFFMVVAKCNAQLPKLEWAKAIGGANLYETGSSVAVDKNGNVFVFGVFAKTYDFDPDTGVYKMTPIGVTDLFICKLNSEGRFVWAKQLGGGFGCTASDIACDEQGNFYLSGSFGNVIDLDPGPLKKMFSADRTDLIIAKYTNDGDLIWGQRIGGGGSESAYDLLLDPSNNVYVSGYFESSVDFNADQLVGDTLHAIGTRDAFLLKLNTYGYYVWAKQIGGLNNRAAAYAMAIDDQERITLAGWYNAQINVPIKNAKQTLLTQGDYDVFVLQCDALGEFLWCKSFGGYGADKCFAIASDFNNNICLTGTFRFTADFNPDSVSQYFIDNKGAMDQYVLKLDSKGNFIWARAFGGDKEIEAHGLQIDLTGNIYTIGFFNGMVDFDPSADTLFFKTEKLYDMFLTKLNDNGDLLWARRFGAGVCMGYHLIVDEKGLLYAVGSFNNTADFDPSYGVFDLKKANDNDVFVVKLNQNNNAKIDRIETSNGLVYPNPTKGQFQIKNSIEANWVSVTIFNHLGEMITLLNIENRNGLIDIHDLPMGVYTLQLKGYYGEMYFQKIIIGAP